MPPPFSAVAGTPQRHPAEGPDPGGAPSDLRLRRAIPDSDRRPDDGQPV